ncbi:T9SS type A sorting domain-containing protein [Tenacibaculum agarivorans]|uniref:T9SS type A sorting domain-containing protein n=1 Tax=Tenacibaculum agarivorans TaxID=1908389 RepID=UPI00094BA09C|nr:T9SS type A sorting domain-containing protein [Tenacibaculum agarivorans]
MKKNNFLTLLLILSALFSATSQNFDEKSLEERSRPFGEADDPTINWKIRWDRSDLFKNDNFPDPDFKYNTRIWAKEPENVQSWVWRNKQNIEQKNGSLFITARYSETGFPENRVPDGCINGSPSTKMVPVRFSSGMLRSTSPGFVYGYYEAAIKGSDGFPGVSPAFWLYNQIRSNTTVGQVRYQEIDVVELTQEGTSQAKRKVMDHNLHAITTASSRQRFDNSLNPPVGAFVPAVDNGALTVGPINSTAGRRWWRPKQNTAAARNETDEFEPRDINIFGCRVTPDEIIWYVNGKEIGRKPNVLWQREADLTNPMRITLSLGIRAPYNQFCSNRFVMPNPTVLTQAENFFPQSMQVLYVKVFEPLNESTQSIPVTGVTLRKSEVPVRVGGNTILTPVIAPNKASNKKFSFYSVSGMDVARVDSKTGIVTALKEGTAIFRVITNEGNFFDDIEVTVSKNPGQNKNAIIPVPPRSAGLAPDNPDDSDDDSSNDGMNCNTIPTWRKANSYTKGDKVKLNNTIYELQNNSVGKCKPGGNATCSTKQWKKIGTCDTSQRSLTKANEKIKVFPNPSVQVVNITSEQNALIYITNTAGKIVLSKVAKGEITSFDTHNFSKGLYLIRVQKDNVTTTKKLIIK